MFQLSHDAYHAIHAVIRIAQADHCTSPNLAENLGVAERDLTPVLRSLVQGGILRVEPRGYVLGCPTEEVTVLDIIEVVEGPMRADIEATETGDDDVDEALKEACDLAVQGCSRVLAATSIARLISKTVL
ncbi:hypothetical protein AYO40_00530 [Planctomycetaceae bacterium SCGC AG-212-D15]|nr:hypothetical protein AYO40_00530 [Planctomycetaceae bacterium SCGC AG-212-D15]